MNAQSLAGRKALVTGGARGIGAEIATALAKAGASVMIGDILVDLARETAGGIAKLGVTAGATKLDVTDDNQWEQAVGATLSTLGGFDILINNAGIEITSLIVDIRAEDVLRMCNVNVVGAALGMKHAFRAMRPSGAAGKGGAVVNIASVAATIAFPAIAGYSGTKSAVIEAIDARIPLCIVITEGVPVHDTAEFWARASAAGNRTRIIGPNCPGVASPGKSNAGIIPADITSEGRIGLVSKSGTLTYQMMYELRDIGFSTAVGIGGDPIIGTTHIDCLQAFEEDPETDAIVMIGEIGGDAEERAGAFIEQHVTKPVVGYVAGFTAPEGKTMGHAGAIISGSSGTAQAKKEALEKAGVRVGKTPSETAALVRDIMNR